MAIEELLQESLEVATDSEDLSMFAEGNVGRLP